MSNYEYKKEYNKKWNEANTKTITIRLSNSQYEKLQKYCEDNSIARASFIKSRISDVID